MKQATALVNKMDTDYAGMSQISKAGGGLFKFVNAVLGYCDVARQIKPKRDRVRCLWRSIHLPLTNSRDLIQFGHVHICIYKDMKDGAYLEHCAKSY